MKKTIFSVLAFLLTALLLTLTFVGCDGEGNGGETDTVSPESLADTETQAPDPMSGYLPLTENGKALYVVVALPPFSATYLMTVPSLASLSR